LWLGRGLHWAGRRDANSLAHFTRILTPAGQAQVTCKLRTLNNSEV
jgi:hypothetical protein